MTTFTTDKQPFCSSMMARFLSSVTMPGTTTVFLLSIWGPFFTTIKCQNCIFLGRWVDFSVGNFTWSFPRNLVCFLPNSKLLNAKVVSRQMRQKQFLEWQESVQQFPDITDELSMNEAWHSSKQIFSIFSSQSNPHLHVIPVNGIFLCPCPLLW